MITNADIESAATNKWLHLVLNVTEQCNLRCHYCYETHVNGIMDHNVQDSIVKLVKRRAESGLERLNVNLFGGEPLLAWPVIENVISKIVEIVDNFGLRFEINMTTNGVLLDQKRFDFLLNSGLNGLLISLDGPKVTHDKIRVRKNRSGTFVEVLDALSMIKDRLASESRKCKTTIGFHFSPDTIQEIYDSQFIEDLTKQFLAGDDNFEISISEIKKFGGSNDNKIVTFAGDSKRHYAELESRAISAGCLPSQIAKHRGMCFAAMANSFVVRPDGRLSKCTIALDDKINIVGKLNYDGEIELNDKNFYPWIVGLATGDEKWLQCPKYHVGELHKLIES